MNNISISSYLLGQIVYILFRKKIDIEFRLAAILGSVATAVYLIIAYYKLGGIHESSKILIRSWKSYNGLFREDRKLFKKYIRSLGLLKLHHGDFGHYTKQNRILIVGKLIYYTSKCLMVIQKFL